MKITVEELKNNLNNFDLIDIRSIQKYNNNHLPNSINIPYSKIVLTYKDILEKEKKYVIYCEKGITSEKLVNYLNKQGYICYNLVGGYEEWIINNN